MREYYIEVLKPYLRTKVLLAREHMGITQEKMAELLEMNTRSYAEIESGKSFMSALSFILFCLRCDVDAIVMLDEIRNKLTD